MHDAQIYILDDARLNVNLPKKIQYFQYFCNSSHQLLIRATDSSHFLVHVTVSARLYTRKYYVSQYQQGQPPLVIRSY